MNKEREALEIALDYVLRTTYWTEGRNRHDTLKAIKEALAQPEQEQDSTCSATLRRQGKPYPRTCKKCGLGPCVAKLVAQSLPYAVKTYHEGRPVYVAQPKQDAGYVCVDGYRHPAAFIYTTPPKRKPLTLNEMSAIEEQVYMKTTHKGKPSFEYAQALIRATEAAHGIKENT